MYYERRRAGTLVIEGLGKKYTFPRGVDPRRSPKTLWALRDVSLEVHTGEVVGLIGNNGAGKSTLLKLLSRVTDPTEGTARIYGKVGALLEVGTGFHSELTGRENVSLSGAMLGMGRKELRRKADDIISFAEVEDFADVPVKRYSSGMYMRLAFSVAAHLDVEVMLVDEALAVGDVAFQRKCLGKMDEVSRSGRTILFVSHNLGAISNLCQRSVWLDHGVVQMVGETERVIRGYLRVSSTEPIVTFPSDPELSAQIKSVAIRSVGGDAAGWVSCDDGFVIEIETEFRRQVPGGSVAFWLVNQQGVVVLSSDIGHSTENWEALLTRGCHRFRIVAPSRLVAPGVYSLTVAVVSPYFGDIDRKVGACSVSIVDPSTRSGPSRAGVIGLNLPWVHVCDDK